MSYELTCVACGDTGRNSRGGLCRPCAAHGRQPLRDAVLRAIEQTFETARQRGRVPQPDDVMRVVRAAMEPRVTYAAGFRVDGEIAMFGGPTEDYEELLGITPPHPPGGPAFIIRMIKSTEPSTLPMLKPVAKWNGERWVERKRT